MAGSWEAGRPLSRVAANKVQKNWDILGVGDKKEKTLETLKSPAQPWPGFAESSCNNPKSTSVYADFSASSFHPVSYINISLVSLVSFLEQSWGSSGLTKLWISR